MRVEERTPAEADVQASKLQQEIGNAEEIRRLAPRAVGVIATSFLGPVLLTGPALDVIRATVGGDLDGWVAPVVSGLVLATFIMAISSSLWMPYEPRTRSMAVVTVALLGPGLWLAQAGTRIADDPDGDSLQVHVLVEPAATTPRSLHMVLRRDFFWIECTTCRPGAPALLAIEGDPRVFGENGFTASPASDSAPGRVTILGTVRAEDPDYEGDVDITVVEVTGPATVVVQMASGTFVETGGARTKIVSPLMRVGGDWLVEVLDTKGFGLWEPPDWLDVETVAGSAAGPSASWEGDYRVDFVTPPPASTDRFFIRWETGEPDIHIAARASVVSPGRESTQEFQIILAGVLAGGGTVAGVEVVSDFLKRLRWGQSRYSYLRKRLREASSVSDTPGTS